MRQLKDSAAVRAGALLVGATGWAPPLVSSTLARAMGGVRAFNLVVSNIPARSSRSTSTAAGCSRSIPPSR